MKNDFPTSSDSDSVRPMAGKWHSKLAEHIEAIRAWRKAGKSYREMAILLKQEKNVEAHPDTINSFVLTRARAAKKGKLMAELPEASTPPAASSEEQPIHRTKSKDSDIIAADQEDDLMKPTTDEEDIFKVKKAPKKQ